MPRLGMPFLAEPALDKTVLSSAGSARNTSHDRELMAVIRMSSPESLRLRIWDVGVCTEIERCRFL